jgi:nicotinate-nucleotide pyrophosphorylase (carboxylating)
MGMSGKQPALVRSPEATEADLRAWLAEDLGAGDVTSQSLVPGDARSTAEILLREAGVVCGLDVARAVFSQLDGELSWEPRHADGDWAEPGELATLAGGTRALLGAERLALNLLGRLSGVATMTRRFVDAVAGTGTTILDTRKTTPGLRAPEKAAVRCGGGMNHRFGLYDGILIKDNHLRFTVSIATAIERARAAGLPVAVECETLTQVGDALAAGADRILLDNMSVAELRQAVRIIGGRLELEASGGVTLDNVRAIAETGVDYISIGALTRGARSLDVSLEFVT